MAARASMASLITKIRVMIYDPAGATQLFTDDHIQDAADARRFDTYTRELQWVESIAEGGVVTYTNNYSEGGWWEDDVTIQDNNYKVLTVITTPVSIATSDEVVGRWTLNTSLAPPVYLTGRQYDLYAVSADLLVEWLAYDKEEFDFLSAGRTFKRSQKFEMIEKLLTLYRSRQRIGYSEMIRTDMNLWAPAPRW